MAVLLRTHRPPKLVRSFLDRLQLQSGRRAWPLGPLRDALRLLVPCQRPFSAAELLKRSLSAHPAGFGPSDLVDSLSVDDDESQLFDLVLRCYVNFGRPDDAAECFQTMVARGARPGPGPRKALLHALVKSGLVGTAREMYEDMLDRRMNGDMEDALRLVGEMIRRGWDLNAVFARSEGTFEASGVDSNNYTYNTIIDGLCKAGQSCEANNMLEKFRKEGFVPITMTYNSIIDGFIKEGAIGSAVAMYQRMSKDGNLRAARALLDEMIVDGLTPNTAIYNTIINGYKHQHDMKSAYELQRRMHEEGVACDLATYTTLLDGALKVGDLVCASQLYQEMVDYGIVPDEVCYTALIHGLCNNGLVENARKFLGEMDANNVPVRVLIYNMLIAGYFNERNVEEAFRLHDQMLDRGLVPNDTLMIFSRMRSSRKLAEVSRVVSRNHYFVRLLGSSSEFKVHKSFIRVQQSWKDEISVLIGKDLGKLNNDKLIRPPKAGDSPMSGFQLPLSDESMKGCPGDDHYPIEKCIPSDECSCRKKRGPPWGHALPMKKT
ncbi:hypothetical protein QJS10_CPB19g00721 [Acorus calamus]|uniref:Pentatricopeptide repeat-containing protein n=1 Tax=Acorus calamus TaxID=4465 RepID=A0AAV9CF68_ACOCL|nr:hypothetical protein QJS10_CPB19g00721 [Acorus calamus]